MLKEDFLENLFALELIDYREMKSYIRVGKIINRLVEEISCCSNINNFKVKNINSKRANELMEKIRNNELELIEVLEQIQEVEFGKLLLKSLSLSNKELKNIANYYNLKVRVKDTKEELINNISTNIIKIKIRRNNFLD